MKSSALSFLLLIFSSTAIAGNANDSQSDFVCGLTLSRAAITSANFHESSDNLLLIPSVRAGQRGFYSLAASGAKYHALPPERAFKKNAQFYYHIFSLEDPKTKRHSRIVYSDIIASPDDAITMTMGEKDKRDFPLSVGVPVDDKTTRQTLMSRFKLSLMTVPMMVSAHLQNDGRAPAAIKSDISQQLSRILCDCHKVADLKGAVESLRGSPALAPFAAPSGCGKSAA